jgi:hypothetical protein
MRRLSNRRYTTRKCKNTACNIKFEPHDRRQEYCEPQCRINANNDKRHLENATRFNDEKQARFNNKVLNTIWNRLLYQKQKRVNGYILEWEKFVFESQAMITINNKTRRNILWYHDYGLELLDPDKRIYELHKKTY